MPIDRSAFKEDYLAGTRNNAEKLVRNYVNRKGKLDAAASDEAEELYREKLEAAIAARKRQKALRKVSEEDMNRGMKETGAAAYKAKTRLKADKMLKNVEPYLDVLDELEGNLPPRTADPMENLVNRAGKVVMALHEKKKELTE